MILVSKADIFLSESLRILAEHLSQVRLAMNLHLSQNSISRYENIEREAGYETLILIADYFHVSLDYLLGRTDNPNSEPTHKH
ncbi:helix-turn-helix domain-containing protein [uncultured Clostridium sp.]|uniref:helix-turn-helix domain-containing protein n=1 Tax=uncultured Clostridium sp. TaxID=59620 RepID=UPI0025FD5070|nr:helix-turn-helix transcriptional regulator [uncultured Clostridium sp.]